MALYDYTCEHFSKAAIAGLLTHELGHHVHRKDVDRWKEIAAKKTNRVFQDLMGWTPQESCRIIHQRVTVILNHREQENIVPKTWVMEPEKQSAADSSDTSLVDKETLLEQLSSVQEYYKTVSSQLATEVVRAWSEIKADEFAQKS